jgi:hypothetical protein
MKPILTNINFVHLFYQLKIMLRVNMNISTFFSTIIIKTYIIYILYKNLKLYQYQYQYQTLVTAFRDSVMNEK